MQDVQDLINDGNRGVVRKVLCLFLGANNLKLASKLLGEEILEMPPDPTSEEIDQAWTIVQDILPLELKVGMIDLSH